MEEEKLKEGIVRVSEKEMITRRDGEIKEDNGKEVV